MKKTSKQNFFATLLKLMDIKTLVAGTVPVIFGTIYSLYRFDRFHWVDLLITLLGIVLLQSSTNMINDVYDHKRGSDGEAKTDEKALASGEISVYNVKKIIGFFMLIDIGIALFYSITLHGGIFVVAVIAVVIMYSYSAGKRPISYTPFGELIAGSTMGFGIMTTVIFIQSGNVNSETVLVALPTSLFIGTILLTNNLSDHQEDQQVGRKTLPILLGTQKSQLLWNSNCISLLVFTGVGVALGYFPLISFILTIVLFPYKQILVFNTTEKVVQNKGILMGIIAQVGIRFHVAIILGLLLDWCIKKLM